MVGEDVVHVSGDFGAVIHYRGTHIDTRGTPHQRFKGYASLYIVSNLCLDSFVILLDFTIFEGFVGTLEQQTLLRVHGLRNVSQTKHALKLSPHLRFIRRYIEELRVEETNVFLEKVRSS